MKYIFIILCNSILINAFCQKDSTNLVRYDFSFRFNDGLYLDFSGVLTNNAIPFERIVEPSSDDPSFFELLDEIKTVKYYDNFGSLKEINIINVWGYSRHGKPYVYWAGKFNLISYLGSVSHFVTTVMVQYTTGGYDPFYGSYYYNNYYPPRTYRSEELKQFFIDFETGKVFPADSKSVEVLLSKEPELQKEFSKLGKRKKNKRMFDYIRQYNELKPLYIIKS
ncbi:MAG: hypothetical protein LBQ22_11445 [Bacteroidales bacterium]|jgi:hypothetical protein|nr:hypothetical protein [Bacteroidales bacterium]